jgi:hypothetical protein
MHTQKRKDYIHPLLVIVVRIQLDQEIERRKKGGVRETKHGEPSGLGIGKRSTLVRLAALLACTHSITSAALSVLGICKNTVTKKQNATPF